VVVGTKPSVSRESEFMVAAVRRFFHPEAAPPDISRIESEIEIDWRELMRLSSAHAVTPLLYRALSDRFRYPNMRRNVSARRSKRMPAGTWR